MAALGSCPEPVDPSRGSPPPCPHHLTLLLGVGWGGFAAQ